MRKRPMSSADDATAELLSQMEALRAELREKDVFLDCVAVRERPSLTNETLRRAIQEWSKGGEARRKVEAMHGPIHAWDTRAVTNMAWLFKMSSEAANASFDPEKRAGLSQFAKRRAWDTSNVTDMTGMFAYTSFNRPLPDTFDTRNVEDMSYMFLFAESYNQPLPASFDTAKVRSMVAMFDHARAFDQEFPDAFVVSEETNTFRMFGEVRPYVWRPMRKKKYA